MPCGGASPTLCKRLPTCWKNADQTSSVCHQLATQDCSNCMHIDKRVGSQKFKKCDLTEKKNIACKMPTGRPCGSCGPSVHPMRGWCLLRCRCLACTAGTACCGGAMYPH